MHLSAGGVPRIAQGSALGGVVLYPRVLSGCLDYLTDHPALRARLGETREHRLPSLAAGEGVAEEWRWAWPDVEVVTAPREHHDLTAHWTAD